MAVSSKTLSTSARMSARNIRLGAGSCTFGGSSSSTCTLGGSSSSTSSVARKAEKYSSEKISSFSEKINRGFSTQLERSILAGDNRAKNAVVGPEVISGSIISGSKARVFRAGSLDAAATRPTVVHSNHVKRQHHTLLLSDYVSTIANNNWWKTTPLIVNIPDSIQHQRRLFSIQQRRSFSIHLRESGKAESVGVYDTVKNVCATAWPTGNKGLQMRLGLSIGALILGKSATIVAPLMLGRLVNQLSTGGSISTPFGGGGKEDDVDSDGGGANVITIPEDMASSGNSAAAADTLLTTTDSLLWSSPEMLPIWFLVSYGMARLSGSFFGELKTFLFAKVSQHACRTQALSVFTHVHKLDVEYLANTRSGEIQSTMNRALKSIQSVLHTTLYTVAPTLLEFGFTLAIVTSHMGFMSSCIVFSTFCGYFGFTTWYSNARREYMKNSNKAEDKLGGLLIDSIVNCEAVRYFGNQKFEAKRYDKNLEKFETSQIQVLQSLAFLNFGQQCIVNAGLFAIMALATGNVLNGAMAVGDLVALNTLVLQLAVPLNFLGGAYRITLQGVLDIQKLNSFLAKKPTIVPGEKIYEYKGGEIVLENVKCRALEDISMHIPAGNKIGIVGPSGSGKSTILKLLCRLADPEPRTAPEEPFSAPVDDTGDSHEVIQINGKEILPSDDDPYLGKNKRKEPSKPGKSSSIRIDGQELRDLDLDSYTKYLGVVPQESVLFNDSLLFNLRYANPDASEEQIHRACESAQIHDVISSMEKGYDTKVGERGSRLSGGERQRIAIARCLLRDPQILLFDEATASLDLQTEANLTRAIDEFTNKYSNKTMIFVAHRLSTVQKCDKIFYVEDGKIAEEGTHQELMEKENGKYRELWRLNKVMSKPKVES